MTLNPRRHRLLLISLLALLVALALPGAAGAVELKIVNASTHHDDEVWVAVFGQPKYQVSDDESHPIAANEPKRLSELHGGILEIDEIENGRVYISYGTPTVEPPDFTSTTSRFGWVELNATGAKADKINLTAVDQFGIGMRLDSYGILGQHLEELGSANSETIFSALQGIPGGKEATIRDPASGQVLRVLSPTHSDAYPDLGDFVRSMAAKEITVHSTFSDSDGFTSSRYSGSFAADGSITLRGSYAGPLVPAHEAPAEIHFAGQQLIEDAYTGANTPNNLEGSIRHDVLVGFMAGYWDGRYGNDALGFCGVGDREEHRPGYEAFPYCRTGFNQPAYGAARLALSPFPTCEQYAAVIGRYAETYGNPYSDGAAGNVAINVNQSEAGTPVGSLSLTILPDAGNAQPTNAGNDNCGIAPPPAPPAPPSPTGSGSPAATMPAASTGAGKATVAVGISFLDRAHVRRGRARVAVLRCPAGCGSVLVLAKRGRQLLGRTKLKRAGRRTPLVLRLTKPGRRALAARPRAKVKLALRFKPAGQPARKLGHSIMLMRGGARKRGG